LSIAMTGFSLSTAIFVIASIIILSLIHYFFKPYLRDLT
jgi:hypothetical protein